MMRSLLAAVATALLVCQSAMAAVPPVIASAASADEAAHDIVCTCVHAPSAECPMHKQKRHPRVPPASRQTRCRADTTPAQSAVAATVIQMAGLPEAKHVLTIPHRDATAPSTRFSPTTDGASPPSAPPPRA